jgi:hypothetical protein
LSKFTSLFRTGWTDKGLNSKIFLSFCLTMIFSEKSFLKFDKIHPFRDGAGQNINKIYATGQKEFNKNLKAGITWMVFPSISFSISLSYETMYPLSTLNFLIKAINPLKFNFPYLISFVNPLLTSPFPPVVLKVKTKYNYSFMITTHWRNNWR